MIQVHNMASKIGATVYLQMQICLVYNFPFTPKHRNAVSRARHRGRVAYNVNERKEQKIYTKKVISLL